MTDCIFCAIVAGHAPARVVHETPRTVAFLDINPATRGHTLVIPRDHARDLHDVHVIPRYPDDGLVLPWVPTPGDQRVLDAAAADLRGALRSA
ncbi:HIT family protein [Egicoccus sp. AB-alg2]|uniref:HIT family protein n=1 Tax=Egicoccus sp. AB-alg2 TaxID=3242693 RepID=UPI00359E929B